MASRSKKGIKQDLGYGEMSVKGKSRNSDSGSSQDPQPDQQNKDEREDMHAVPSDTINLAFLTNQERKVIKTVIQADLEFRSTILGSLRRSIDEAQQSQTEETPEQSKPGLFCAVCGVKIITICSRVFAVKCSDCGRFICEKCAGKQVNRICLHCKKRRAVELQMLDYESILHYGMHGNRVGAENTPFCAESELIERSLHIASDPTQDISDESLVYMCSFYSEQCYSGVEISGYLYLAVWYTSEEKRLYVRVHKTRGLAEATNGSLNPYVQMYLLPEVQKSNKRISGVQIDTSTPVWDEIVTYSDLTQKEVKTRTLWASVWNWNGYGRQQFLGEVHIPLKNRDLERSRSKRFQLCDSENLEVNISRPEKGHYKISGEVLIKIKFKDGFLRVKIIRAAGLSAVHGNVTFNPYIRTYLLPDWSKESKAKMIYIDETANPVYNQGLIYRVSEEEIQMRTLWVSVWNHNPVGTNLFMGETCISLAGGDLLHSIERWYELYDYAECGVVVMVTPFGHTLQKCFKPLPADNVKLSDQNEATQNEDVPDTPLTVSIPTVKTEDMPTQDTSKLTVEVT